MDDDEWRKIDRCIHGYFQYDQCEYCHAPKREWVGLTEDEMSECNFDADEHMVDREIAKRNVQAMLKEKNYG